MPAKIEQRHREAAAAYMEAANWSTQSAINTRAGLSDSPTRRGAGKFASGFSPEHELMMTFVRFEQGEFGELSHD